MRLLVAVLFVSVLYMEVATVRMAIWWREKYVSRLSTIYCCFLLSPTTTVIRHCPLIVSEASCWSMIVELLSSVGQSWPLRLPAVEKAIGRVSSHQWLMTRRGNRALVLRRAFYGLQLVDALTLTVLNSDSHDHLAFDNMFKVTESRRQPSSAEAQLIQVLNQFSDPKSRFVNYH